MFSVRGCQRIKQNKHNKKVNLFLVNNDLNANKKVHVQLIYIIMCTYKMGLYLFMSAILECIYKTKNVLI